MKTHASKDAGRGASVSSVSQVGGVEFGGMKGDGESR
jgi:hypothetical protein